MKKMRLKSILQVLIILSVLAGLLLCLNGCKKTPIDNGGNSTLSASTGETDPSENTAPSKNTEPTKNTTPSESTSPTDVTTPTNVTTPTDETPPADCEHVLGNWTVERASTCTTEGIRYKECKLCNYKVETEVIPIVPHTGGTWIVDKKATCTEEGNQHQECAQCKITLLSITVSKTDHNVKKLSGYDATATERGKTTGYICLTCGNDVQEQFTILPLNSLGVTYTVNADRKTCTVTGVVNRRGTSVILPNAIDGYTVVAIGDNAFSGCTALQTVYLPDTVSNIGARAFHGCTALINITFEGTTLQWISLSKGANWDASSGNYNVYCRNNHLPK